jgi:hypothetical protein
MGTIETDYSKKRTVELNKQIYDILIITEKNQLVMNNADILEFYFIEDIFKFCMVGSMTFNDRYNIMEYGPFTGNEKIAIIYAVGDNEPRKLVFDVWKVSKIQQIGTGINESTENLITISFVDAFYTGFAMRRFSRSWSNSYYSDIMKDILNNMVRFKTVGAPFQVEESSNKTDFIMPYWTPQMALRWLMRRAKGKKTGTSGYICFNSTKNNLTHYLTTMNYLLDDQDKSLDTLPYNFAANEVSGENKILEWWINGIDKNSWGSIRGGRWRGYDFSTKKLLDHEHLYSIGADETTCLGRKTLYNQIDDVTSSSLILGDNENSELENIAYSDWAKDYNMQFIMNIIVQGHEKRYAGQQIEIAWPSALRNIGSNSTNALLKGRYLIKSVTHFFAPGGTFPYKQRLVLIKNAYNSIESEILYNAKKVNVFVDKKLNTQFVRK